MWSARPLLPRKRCSPEARYGTQRPHGPSILKVPGSFHTYLVKFRKILHEPCQGTLSENHHEAAKRKVRHWSALESAATHTSLCRPCPFLDEISMRCRA